MEDKQLEMLLAEAADMLDDVREKFGLFEKQRYYRFRSALDEFTARACGPILEDDGR